jgi:hypothetical protein
MRKNKKKGMQTRTCALAGNGETSHAKTQIAGEMRTQLPGWAIAPK